MSNLDLMEAKLKLQDYLANAPKTYHCKGIITVNGKEREVDATVKAHTADQAKQNFVYYFQKEGGIPVCKSVVRKQGYIEKNGGIR